MPNISALATARVLREAADLEEVFGSALDRVHPYLLRMGHIIERPVPAWLKGATQLHDLPRFKLLRDGQLVSSLGMTPIDIAHRLIFIADNLVDDWSLGKRGFLFSTDRDIVYFKLRFSE